MQGAALRSGGQRKLALPESGPDPTDTDTALAAFLARRRELSGERRLLLAVFETALIDLRRYPSCHKEHAKAAAWLVSDDEEWPLAFRPACAELGLDPSAVRACVLATVAARGAA